MRGLCILAVSQRVRERWQESVLPYIHEDKRRTVHEYMQGARSRYGASTGMIVSFGMIALVILFMLFAPAKTNKGAARETPITINAPKTK
jgi:hypothetical protein